MGCNDFPFGPVLHGLEPRQVGVDFVEDHLIFIAAAGCVRETAGLVSVQGARHVFYCDHNVVLALVSLGFIVLLVFGLCMFCGPDAFGLAENVALMGLLGLGEKLWTFLTLMRGQERYFPWQMDLIHVLFVGKPAASWRYRMAGSMLGSS